MLQGIGNLINGMLRDDRSFPVSFTRPGARHLLLSEGMKHPCLLPSFLPSFVPSFFQAVKYLDALAVRKTEAGPQGPGFEKFLRYCVYTLADQGVQL